VKLLTEFAMVSSPALHLLPHTTHPEAVAKIILKQGN